MAITIIAGRGTETVSPCPISPLLSCHRCYRHVRPITRVSLKSLKITLVQMPAQIALPPVPHRSGLLAAAREQTKKQAAGEPQPDWIVCPLAPARRIAACHPPQPDPCSELPRPRSAWPAPAE